MRPERTYPRCETWHESVPAIGLTLFDHFQPGSNVALPTTCPPMLRTSAFPIPSNGRVSSGESKFLISACATSAPSVVNRQLQPYSRPPASIRGYAPVPGRTKTALLPQPGGFEGFLPVEESLSANDLAVAEGPELEKLYVDLRAARLASPTEVDDCEHAVLCLDQLLQLRVRFIEVLPNCSRKRVKPSRP